MTKKNRKYLSKNNKISMFFDNNAENIKDNGKHPQHLYKAEL